MNEYKLKVIIEAVAEKFDSVVDGVQSKLDDVQNKCTGASAKIEAVGAKVETVGKKMQSAGKVMTAFGAGAVLLGKKWTSAAMEAEQSQTKLTEVMRAMMDATVDDVKAINALIDVEAKSGVVGKTVQRNGAQQLATYLHNKDALKQLIPAMNDLVVQQKGVNATSEDSVNIANMMGKVFSGQVGALRRAGISFDEYQEEVMRSGTEMEKAAMLAEVINQNVGNMNQTMAQTDAGKIAKAKQELSAVGTTIGAALLPALADVAKFASEKAIPKLQEMANWFKSNPIAAKVVLGLTAISAVGGPALIVLGALTEKAGILIRAVSKGSGLFSKVLALPPQALITIAIIAAIAAAFMHLYKTNEQFRAKMQETWAQIKAAMAPAVESLKEAWVSLQPALQTVIEAIGKIAAVALPIIAQIVAAIMTAVAKVLPVIASIAAVVAQITAAIVSVVAGVISFIVDKVGHSVAVIKSSIATIKNFWSAFKDFMAGLWDGISAKISEIWEGIKTKIQTVINAIRAIANSLAAPVKAVFTGIANHISSVFNKIQSAWNGLKSFATGVANGVSNAFSKMVSKVKSIINSFISAANAGISVVNKLPGVSVSRIPHLAHGTRDWAGGFAMMNEGGRGELTYLPNGAQVIPHDVSMKYAKESARYNGNSTDMAAMMNGMTNAIMTGLRMSGNNGGGEYHFTVELGGTRVAEQIYKLNKEGTMIMQGA